MRLPGDDEYKNSGLSKKYMVLGVALCLLLVLGVIALTTKENGTKKVKEKETAVLALEHEGKDAQEGLSVAGESIYPDTYAPSVLSDMNGNGTTTAGEMIPEIADTTADYVASDSMAMDNRSESHSMMTAAGETQGEKPKSELSQKEQVQEKQERTESEASESGDAVQKASEPVIMNFNGGKSWKDVERLYKEGTLVASDLDFWDMYPENTPEQMIRTSETAGSSEKKSEETEQDEEKEEEKTQGNPTDRYSRFEEAAQKELESDPSRDGKHTLIKGLNGSQEWVLINPYLEQNTYDFSKLSMKNKKMVYYENGKQTSYIGVDLSKYNNEVDFQSLKTAGVDFVMLRLGSRGYGSGQIMLDERFVEYITKATEAGLQIGVYFFSQAITKDEAIEEANFVIQNLANYKLTYPVAIDMEYVRNDSARIDALTREEKTTITKTFLKTIKEAGYKPMIYGTKEWLIKEIDLTKLTEYDIWLSQQEDEPDYPYQFQMWQYTLEGSISGVTGDVDMNISFVDYSEK